MELRTDREKVAHLLRRFGLGASEAETDYYAKMGLDGAVEALLSYENVDEGFDVPIGKFKAAARDVLPIVGVQGWWVLRLLATRRPLQEKMTLFWHNHFATSAAKVNPPALMHQQNNVIRQFATAKFHDLLSNVSKDPAMLLWLDNRYNVVGRANENFAREVMELFTLGIGHYTEKDVQEGARAFTGWAFRQVITGDDSLGKNGRTAEFFFRERLHDNDPKTYLGNTGNFDGDDVLGILVGNPQCARFITTKIWKWFVYDNPEPAVIDKFASDWYSNGLDIKYLLRKIMHSDEFYSDRSFRRVFKNPVDFVIAPLRQLGMGAQLVQAIAAQDRVEGVPRAVISAAQIALKTMGMNLLFPPDVAGWDLGPAWISSATMVERMAFGPTLFGEALSSKSPRIRYDGYPLFQADLTPSGVVKKLLSVVDAPIQERTVREIVHDAMELSQGAVTEANCNEVAAQTCRLIFGCPEYQFV